VIDTNMEVLESITKEDLELAQYLTKVIQQAPENISKTNAAGCLIMLTGFSCKDFDDAAKEIAKPLLIQMIQEGGSEVSNCLDILMEAAATSNARSFVVQMGAKDLLASFVQDSSSPHHFVASLIIALISSSEALIRSSPDLELIPVRTDPISAAAITQMIGSLKDFTTSTKTDVYHSDGFVAHCKIILLAISSLATNEIDLKALKKADIVNLMIDFMIKRKSDFLDHSAETLEQVENFHFHFRFHFHFIFVLLFFFLVFLTLLI